MKYNPEITCTPRRRPKDQRWALPDARAAPTAKSLNHGRRHLLLGDDPYRYPDNLPGRGRQGAAQEANRAADHFPDVRPELAGTILWSPNTGFGNRHRHAPQIPVIGFSPATSTTCPSHAQFPRARRAFAYRGGPSPPARSPTRARRPTAHPKYGPDGTPLYPGMPPPPPTGGSRRPRCRPPRARPTLRQTDSPAPAPPTVTRVNPK